MPSASDRIKQDLEVGQVYLVFWRGRYDRPMTLVKKGRRWMYFEVEGKRYRTTAADVHGEA
jgi:hypothetical protein